MQQLSFSEQDNRKVANILALPFIIKSAMNRAAAASAYSRQQIVDRMNQITLPHGISLTGGRSKKLHLDTFEKWLNPNAPEHIPGVRAIEVFMQALNTLEPLSSWLDLHETEILTEEGRLYRDLGMAVTNKEEAAEAARSVKSKLKEVRK